MIDFSEHSIHRWCDRLPISGFTALKCILNDGTRLHVHLRATTESSEGYPSHYCAIFYLGAAMRLKLNKSWHGQYDPIWVGYSDMEFSNITNKTDNLNKTMFIGVINVSKKAQRRLPCLIRLQALNSCPLNFTQASDVFGTLTSEETFTIPDGEFNILGEGGICEKPKLPKQVVKCRPQVVANIANEQGKIGVRLFNLLKPEDALSCVSITYKLSDDSVEVALLHPLNQVINDLEVFLCSAEFEERAVKRMHMLYSHLKKELPPDYTPRIGESQNCP